MNFITVEELQAASTTDMIDNLTDMNNDELVQFHAEVAIAQHKEPQNEGLARLSHLVQVESVRRMY